jgi:hypothetical protein
VEVALVKRSAGILLPLVLVVLAGAVVAAPIKTAVGRGYFALYDAAGKSLDCVSENPGRTWRVNIAQGVPSMADWAGVGTSAGPVFVYTTSSGVGYVLCRFQQGSTSAENSGEPLRGTLAPGRLMSASWKEGQYGATATIVSLAGSTEYTTVFDINMWGTSKQLSQTSRTIIPKRETLPNAGLSFEVPVGFSARWDAGSGCMFVASDNQLPAGIVVHAAAGGVELSAFADEFMKLIGPGMGVPDLQQVLSDRVSVGAMPGLLRLGRGTLKGKAGTFAFVFAAGPQNTFVLLYGAPTVNYDQYAPVFYRLLGSVRVQ